MNITINLSHYGEAPFTGANFPDTNLCAEVSHITDHQKNPCLLLSHFQTITETTSETTSDTPDITKNFLLNIKAILLYPDKIMVISHDSSQKIASKVFTNPNTQELHLEFVVNTVRRIACSKDIPSHCSRHMIFTPSASLQSLRPASVGSYSIESAIAATAHSIEARV